MKWQFLIFVHFYDENYIKFLFSDNTISHNLQFFSAKIDFLKMDIENDIPEITIGYYPFRGKAQICRLLCEYLRIPFQDKQFTPDQWNQYKENTNNKWIIKDLPFLQHGDFIVTGTGAIIHYIIEYACRTDLVGKTIDDKLKMDTIRSHCNLNQTMLGVNCTTRPSCPAQLKKCMNFYWQRKMLPIMRSYDNDCLKDNWYFGYVTIMDFIVYQIINHVEKMFPHQVKQFSKLLALRTRFSMLPQIQAYESSKRAVTEYCPVRYFSRFKEQKLRASQLNSSVSSTNSNRNSHMDMDIE